MAVTEGAAIRKRQQIAKANRAMFLWIAGASVVVGASIVVTVFLFQKMTFNQRVISKKSETSSILKKNNEVAGDLQGEIRALNAEESLKKLIVSSEKDPEPVQVVLDALPATANASAFGASMQGKLLKMNGIDIESLSVDAVSDEAIPGPDVIESPIGFSFAVRASSPQAAKNLLTRLERSIRPIKITRLIVESRGDGVLMRADGETYYQPARSVELRNEVVQP